MAFEVLLQVRHNRPQLGQMEIPELGLMRVTPIFLGGGRYNDRAENLYGTTIEGRFSG